MAIDTQEKRMSASGAGRPWRRAKFPGTNDAQWRISSGNAYGGNAVANPIILGPYSVEAAQVFVAGAVAAEVFVAGPVASEVFVAGASQAGST